MKLKFNTSFVILLILFFCVKPQIGSAATKYPEKTTPQVEVSTSEITLNKKELENRLGRKLTLKEKVLLPLVKKQIKKSKKKSKVIGSGKSQIVALILCIFLGLLGIHRFYLGYTGMGVIYILTLGLFGIGWLIDLILLIIPNGLTPKGQTNYKG